MKKGILSLLGAAGWVAAFFGLQLFAAVLVAVPIGFLAGISPAGMADPDFVNRTLNAANIPITLLSYLFTVWVLLIAFYGCRQNLWHECHLWRVPTRLYCWPVLTAFFLYLSLNSFLLVAELPAALSQPLEEYNSEMSASGTLLMLLCAVVLAPIIEEIVFRGLVYRSLRRGLPVIACILLSALAFGLVHFSGGLVLMLPAMLIGLVSALTLERTGSLLPCIAAHIASNFTLIPQLVLQFCPDPVVWAAGALSLLLALLSAFFLLTRPLN